MRKILTALIVLMTILPGYALNREEVRRDLEKQLSEAGTGRDSIRILYDMLDVAYIKNMPYVGRMLYNTARRNGDTATQLDVLRLLSAISMEVPYTEALLEEVDKIPESREQQETKMYLQIWMTAARARAASDEQRQQNIIKYIEDYENNTADTDPKEELLELCAICSYLRYLVQGDLLVKYLDEMNRVIDECDIELYAIYNIIRSRAASLYTNTGQYEKAVAADRELLKEIKSLEKQYAAKGRKYRNYARNYYLCYNRMLSNYKALSQADIEDCYRKLIELTEQDFDVKASYMANPAPDVYHAMGLGRYAEAIPLIRKQLSEVEMSVDNKIKFYDMLLEAAEKTGDKEARVEALQGRSDILSDYDKELNEDRIKELEINLQVNKLQRANDVLALKQQEQDIESSRRIMNMVIAAWVLLVFIILVGVYLFTRHQRAVGRMTDFVRQLVGERNVMKNREYGRPENYGDEKVKVSIADPRLMERLLNNILCIASLGRENRRQNVRVVSAESLLNSVVAESRSFLGPSVDIEVKFPEPPFELETDAEAVKYILTSLVKFSVRNCGPTARIELEAKLLEADRKVRFTVTDNGKPVREGDEQLIFRYFATSEMFPRAQEGVIVCREVAVLLDGSLRVDREYRDGARMVLTLPLK